ncbi:hypothetical protein LCGC14_0495160 [marine sediment metagenome]|uniref:Uncharacterized protein n=1 Tax=marine sediment metagenome TaxID=412755 RepID=A0A0F9SAK9_9ZZZZ
MMLKDLKKKSKYPPGNCTECGYIADCIGYFTTCPFLSLPAEERRKFWIPWFKKFKRY